MFDLLCLLAENAGRVVSKDELIAVVWGGRIVSEATVSARINAARNAVGDSGKAQAVIRTAPRRGFGMVAEVKVAEADAKQAPDGAATLKQTIRYTTSRDGTGIAYAVSGEGPPLLRAGHHLTHLELDWSSPLWAPHFELLSRHFTLIRYDVRGAGLSKSVLDGANLESYVEDLEAVADAAGVDRFALLATLQSAPAALRFAADNPGRVERLILQNGYARGRGMRDGVPEDPDADPMISLVKGGSWGDPDNPFMRAFCALAVPSLDFEGVTELARLFAGAAGGADVIAARRLINYFDATGDLARVRAATLVMHARNCAIHPLDEGRLIAARVPGAEFEVFDSADSACVPTDPSFEAQNAAIVDFLKRG